MSEQELEKIACKSSFIKLLKKLKKNNKIIKVYIKSGSDCCELRGCIGQIVDGSYITLISSNNACLRKYIPINCICAILDQDGN